MTRAERAAAVEEAARTGRTGPNGLYTPAMIESMEPSKIAAVMNSYVDRLNLDQIAEAKRKARSLALTIFVAGVATGGVAVYVAMSLWFNPLREVLRHLTEK